MKILLNTMITLPFILSVSAAFAEPLMTKTQYIDYSVLYQCAEMNFHNDLKKKEAELIRIEKLFKLNDDNFDAFDDLITQYERDEKLLDTVRVRVSKEC